MELGYTYLTYNILSWMSRYIHNTHPFNGCTRECSITTFTDYLNRWATSWIFGESNPKYYIIMNNINSEDIWKNLSCLPRPGIKSRISSWLFSFYKYVWKTTTPQIFQNRRESRLCVFSVPGWKSTTGLGFFIGLPRLKLESNLSF